MYRIYICIKIKIVHTCVYGAFRKTVRVIKYMFSTSEKSPPRQRRCPPSPPHRSPTTPRSGGAAAVSIKFPVGSSRPGPGVIGFVKCARFGSSARTWRVFNSRAAAARKPVKEDSKEVKNRPVVSADPFPRFARRPV